MNKIFILFIIGLFSFIWSCSSSKSNFSLNDKSVKTNATYIVPFRFYNLSAQIEEVFEKNKAEVDSIISFINKHPKYIFEIGVYTDYRGADALNLKVSEKQAICFAHYLITKGVNTAQLKIKGYGETNLINDETKINSLQSEEEKTNAHLENGRIIIKVLKK